MDEPLSELPRQYEPSFSPQAVSLVGKMLEIAKFMGSDSDRRVFNRFNELRTFVILRLQHRLTTLAAQLENGAAGMDENSLEALAMNIERTLKEYGKECHHK